MFSFWGERDKDDNVNIIFIFVVGNGMLRNVCSNGGGNRKIISKKYVISFGWI
jgi:hypothetical protein